MSTTPEQPPVSEQAIPEWLIEESLKRVDHLTLIADGNRAAFLATTEGEFGRPISTHLAAQKVYAEHLVKYADVRARALGVTLDELPDLSSLPRAELVELYTQRTVVLIGALRNRSNLARRFDIPWAGSVSGISLISDVRAHEAQHLGMNKDALGHFGHEFPPEVIAPYGK